MPVYDIDLSDGRTVTVESDTEPTEQDVFGALESYKEPSADLGSVLNQKPVEVPYSPGMPYGAPPPDIGPETSGRLGVLGEALREIPEPISRGLHYAMQPVEKIAAPLSSFAGIGMAAKLAKLASGAPPETFFEQTFKPGESVIPGLEPQEGAVGVIPSLRRFLAGATTPGMLAVAPFAGLSRLASGAFALGGAASIPPSVAALAEAKTPAEARGALTDIGLGTLVTAGAGRAAFPSAPEVPITITPRFDLAQQLENRIRAQTAAEAGSPFVRIEPPPETIGMGFRTQPPLELTAEIVPAVKPGISMEGKPVEFSPTVDIRETFEPSGLQLNPELQTGVRGLGIPPEVRQMRPIPPGFGEEITAPSVETVHAQRALEARQAEAAKQTPEARQEGLSKFKAVEWNEADFNRYNELLKEQSALKDANKIIDNTGNYTPEWLKNWTEFETIRNEHGGMPPIQVSIANQLGVEYRGALKAGGKETWSFHDPQTGSNVGIPKGSTFEQARTKIESKRAEFVEESQPKGGVERGLQEKRQEKEVLTEPTVEQVTPLDVASGRPLTALESLINRLEALKFPETREARLYAFPHPDAIKAIGRSTWNSAVDVAIAAVKAGRKIGEAVDEAVSFLKKNVKGLDETKARANLEYVAGQETKPTPSAPAAQPKPTAAKAVTLDDVYKRFEIEPKPKTGPSVVKIVEAVRTGLASKFRPIDKLAEDIGRAYGATTPKGISGIFEQLKGSTGKAEADIYRFDQNVSKLVKGSEKDFNAYMFLRRSLDRLRQDLADIQTAQAGGEVKDLNRRRVAGYTIPELESKLALLESKIGPEKVRTFEEASNRYQQFMDESLRLQVESGRMSPEIYKAIKEGNQFYAPFKVMKYYQEIARPEGTGRKIDTVADYTKAMEGIEDPNFKLGDMLSAGRQNIMLSRILAEKNYAMRRIAQLAEFDVDGIFIRKLKAGQEPAKDMMTVNVKEDGKTERYEVNKDVADAIQTYSGVSNNFIVQMMGWFAIPMKAGATAWNIPFQISNLMADIPRQALVSKYGIKNPIDLVRYPLDVISAFYSSIAGDVFKRDNKLFLDFLDSGVAGSTFQEHLTPEALRFKPSTLERTSKSFAKSVLYTLPDIAKAVEQTSKILGVKRAMREHGVTSGKELARQFPEAITEIRRFSGSPDFGRQGKWTEQARLNLVYMFFNARLQGVIADLGRLGGRDGAAVAARTWFRLATAIGLPTAYLYALNNSDEYKEDYAKRPLQEKQNYWLIPKDSYITNEQGEKMRDYWRIPKRESAKWIANMLESSLDFARDQSPEQFDRWVQNLIEDISPVNIQGQTFQERLESAASSLNPVLKAPLEFGSGRNLWRHREIVPEQMKKASPELQYTERTPEVFIKLADTMPDVAPEVFRSPLMLENLTQNLTAGLITQFLPKRPVEGRSAAENFPLLQRFQAVPYSESAAFDQRMKLLEREAADTQLTRFRNAQEIVDANKGKDLRQLANIAEQKYGRDVKMIERLVDLYVAQQRGITGQERRILALPVQQRAQFIAQELNGATTQQREVLIRNYANKRILTEAVAVELQPLLSAPKVTPTP